MLNSTNWSPTNILNTLWTIIKSLLGAIGDDTRFIGDDTVLTGDDTAETVVVNPSTVWTPQ